MKLPNVAQIINNPIVASLLPLLQHFGIDPKPLVAKFERDQLEHYMEHATTAVVARLEHDGLTPAIKASSQEGERLLIRATLYLLLKESVKPILASIPGIHGLGANLVADFLRDQHDDAVVAMVSPHLDPSTPTEDLVRMTTVAFCEHVF